MIVAVANPVTAVPLTVTLLARPNTSCVPLTPTVPAVSLPPRETDSEPPLLITESLAAPPDRPLNELEALRKENELLKLNLLVVLEKVRAQEAELHAVRKDLAATKICRDFRLSGARENC